MRRLGAWPSVCLSAGSAGSEAGGEAGAEEGEEGERQKKGQQGAENYTLYNSFPPLGGRRAKRGGEGRSGGRGEGGGRTRLNPIFRQLFIHTLGPLLLRPPSFPILIPLARVV